MERNADALTFSTRYSLLRDVKDLNNDKRWSEFYSIYSAYIEKVVRCEGKSEQTARDIVAKVMEELAAMMPAFVYDTTQGRFRSLVKTMVKRRLIDKFRVEEKEGERLTPGQVSRDGSDTCLRDNQPDPSIPNTRELAAKDFAIAIVRRAMQLLRDPAFKTSEGQLQIFDDYVICEMDATVVANNHNVDVGQVYLSKTRLMPKFKEACVQAMKELAPEETN